MARSIAQQSADDAGKREAARKAAQEEINRQRAAAGVDQNTPLTEAEKQALADADQKAIDAANARPINYDAAGAGTAAPTGTQYSERDSPFVYDSSGRIIGGGTPEQQAAEGARRTAENKAKMAAASGVDAAGDSAAARAFRQQLLDERAALMPNPAPFVYHQEPLQSAVVQNTQEIGAPVIASTAPITGPTVTASPIAPIERVNAAHVAPTGPAQAGVVQAATIDKDPQNAIRERQERYIGLLEGAATGAVPSAAELQMRRGAEDAQAAQLSMVGMNRGRGAGGALRQAGRNVAQLQQRNNLETAMLRATEQEKARSQLGGALGQTREQDIGVATTEGTFKQGANTTNAQLATTVAVSNADRDAARAMKQADLDQAAATGNAAAQNEKSRREAEMKLAADTTTAGLGVDAAKANQATEAQKNAQQADLTFRAEQENAANQLKQSLAQAGFDQQAILQTSAQDLQRMLANAGFQLTQQQIDDMKQRAATDAVLGSQKQMLDFDTAQNQQNTAKEMQRIELQARYDQAKQANDSSMMNSILQAAATAGVALITTLSDKRAKKKIRPTDDGEIDDFLSALESWTYEYKNKADGEGRRSGPMAQELERSEIGRGTVITDKQGRKGIDSAALTMALAGAVARMRKEQRRAAR